MSFDFTTIMDRHGYDALAVDALGQPGFPGAPDPTFDPIPMWVADINFPTAPSITDAIIARAQHPAFGYFQPRKAYYDGIIWWQQQQNAVEGLNKEHIMYANGVLGGIIGALGALCSRGDRVLLHSPTYIGFTHSLEDNGYQIVHSPLQWDGQGIWRMDFADMEQKLRDQKIHVAILCSPHNPTGRVWERWELEQAMALFEKYHVYVISDEIWSDLLLAQHRHTPTQSVSDYAKTHTAAFYAPSKTFNLAGLIGSYAVVYDPWLRHRMESEYTQTHFNSMNVLSMHALMGAYTLEGAAWLTELNQVLTQNVDFACDYILRHFPGLQISKPQGTYMLFVDCAGWCDRTGQTMDELIAACHRVGVHLQDGRPFHGPTHLRINLALPHARVQEAFARLDRYVFNAAK